DREEWDAALRVQRAVDRVDDDRVRAVAVDPDFLADDPVAGEVRQDRLLGLGVDQRRVVAALAVPDDALALASRDPREHCVDVVARRATDAQPVLRRLRQAYASG